MVEHVEWSKNLSMYEVNVRQYSKGGTFKEFREHLPRLKELGVGILWFMPIQTIGVEKRKGTQGSYYSIQDYTAVNKNYGTLEEFKDLVKEIHEMGMYVILDWVANHTAWDHVWTKSNPDFYSKDENGNFRPPIPDWADVIHLNYNNPELRKSMIDAMKFWLTEVNIDGFRCDMAHLVVTDFWNEARAELNKVKPIFMLAESENRDLLNQAFDCLYNWNIFHLINGIARGERCVHDLDHLLQHEIHDYPEASYQLMFTSNHDENSWNGSAIERLGEGLEAFNTLMFTIDGMPLIYSGQEAGEYRRLSFFDKDCIQWNPDKLLDFYTKLIKLKLANPALWNGKYGGSFQRINTSNNWGVFAFIREKDSHKVLVIINLSRYDQGVTLYGNEYTGKYKNIFTEYSEEFTENTWMFLQPWEYKVLAI